MFGCDLRALVHPVICTLALETLGLPDTVLRDPVLILLLHECKLLPVADCSDLVDIVVVVVQLVEQLFMYCWVNILPKQRHVYQLILDAPKLLSVGGAQSQVDEVIFAYRCLSLLLLIRMRILCTCHYVCQQLCHYQNWV